MAESYSGQKNLPEAERVTTLALGIIRRLQKVFHLTGYLSIAARIYFAQEKYEQARQLNNEALELAVKNKSRQFEFHTTILAIHLNYLSGYFDSNAAISQLKDMLTDWTEGDQQAEIYYTIWKIDASQDAMRENAAKLFHSLIEHSPQAGYRDRYEELTGIHIPKPSTFPELPESITLLNINYPEMLSDIEDWLAPKVTRS
ncbi:MAG TPA: hypothetical protein VJZ27_08550, partial [Aggregatilineales bacterium]|nr:hypothetical protein [Aggregatilineales bacterium]